MTATVPSIGRLRTKAETAAFLGVNQRTVQRLVSSGQLKCSRIGTRPRFADDHLAEFLFGDTVPAAPEPVKPARNPKYGPPSRRAA